MKFNHTPPLTLSGFEILNDATLLVIRKKR